MSEETKNPLFERAVLVNVLPDADEREESEFSIGELSRLCETASLEVVAVLTQVLPRLNAAFVIGSGKLQELCDLCEVQEIDVVVFDHDLSPVQIRNIEDALPKKCRVIDRTMLILDIFAKNATTGEGMLQVEIAQLKYNVPRLSGKGVELSRLGGGIGTRGPGESKLETDRRHVRRKIESLEKKLADLAKSRALRRKSRRASGIRQITIAGYTNAGKSTLLNTLTQAGILAEDKLFATLDPTTRRMKLPGAGEVLVTDTVGFIDRLPHHLVEAFASTLDEVAYADLLLIVLDATEENLQGHLRVTEELTAQLYRERGVSAPATVYVYNKCDLLDADTLIPAASDASMNVYVSAKTGQGIDALVSTVARALSSDRRQTYFCLPHNAADRLNYLYRHTGIKNVEYTDEFIRITADADEKTRGKFKDYIVEEFV